MVSVRELAACIFMSQVPVSKWPGEFSLLNDCFGYGKAPGELSLLQLIRSLMRKHINLNLIHVNPPLLFMQSPYEARIDTAVQITRALYAQVDLGVGRINHYFIPESEADGHDYIIDGDEAEALTAEWSFPGDAVDVFLVRVIEGKHVGVSPAPGPCDKERTDKTTGCVIDIEGSIETTAYALAHEVGHYLGLDPFHVDDPDNLMFRNVPNGGQLTASQGEKMKQHCFIRTGCRPG